MDYGIQVLKPKKGYYERKKEKAMIWVAFWSIVLLIGVLLLIEAFRKGV